jgi:hypothetical protein
MPAINPEDVRVLYSYGRPYAVLGPLGCYEVGQRVMVGDVEHEVTSVDPDGAGVARPSAAIAEMRLAGQPIPTGRSAPCNSIEFGFGAPGTAGHERVKAGIEAQCERNRREYGQPAPLAEAA